MTTKHSLAAFFGSFLFGGPVSGARVKNHFEAGLPPLHPGNPTRFPWTKKCIEGATRVYVDGANGKDYSSWDGSEDKPHKTIQYAVSKFSGSCATIYIKAGTYHNSGYTGNPKANKNNRNKVINLNNITDIILRNYGGEHGSGKGGDKVLIKFDGPGGFVGGTKDEPVKDIEIYGLDIEGPNQDIVYADAYADRVEGSAYYSGRGVAIWKGERIHIHHMLVHDTPAAGMRVDNSDYVVIEESEVYHTTWWASSAESAVVLGQSINIDEEQGIKMMLRNNKVYDNMNRIPYYNKKYAWDYSPIGATKCANEPSCESEAKAGQCTGECTCPWTCRYGKITQDYIIDGQGVYVTRNSGTYLKGQMEMSGNECFRNGINGLVFHRTFRGVVKNNLIYDNGIVPKDGHDQVVKQSTDWMKMLAKTRQPYSGLVLNNAEGVNLVGNRVRARYEDDFAFTMEVDHGDSYSLKEGGNNTVCRGRVGQNLQPYVGRGSDEDCASWFGEDGDWLFAPH